MELASFVKRCDVMLMTSHYEGSPTVLVEALGCGVPAVTNKESDPDLLITNGVNGLRLDSSTSMEFAHAILTALNFDRASVSKSVENRGAKVLCLKTISELHPSMF